MIHKISEEVKQEFGTYSISVLGLIRPIYRMVQEMKHELMNEPMICDDLKEKMSYTSEE